MDSCAVCMSKNIIKKTIDETFTYKGESLNIPNYIIYECQECLEKFIDPEQSKQIEPQIREMFKKANKNV